VVSGAIFGCQAGGDAESERAKLGKMMLVKV